MVILQADASQPSPSPSPWLIAASVAALGGLGAIAVAASRRGGRTYRDAEGTFTRDKPLPQGIPWHREDRDHYTSELGRVYRAASGGWLAQPNGDERTYEPHWRGGTLAQAKATVERYGVPRSGHAYFSRLPAGEHWVTIGGHPEGEHQHVGGQPVLIDAGGHIVGGGPGAMHGQKVGDPEAWSHAHTTKQAPRGPFSKRDEDDYNRFTNYPTTVEKMNAEYEAGVEQREDGAADTLRRWGIDTVPPDVQEALDAVARAKVHETREDIRARGIAPGAYIVGPSNYKGNHDRADTIRRNAWEATEKAEARLQRALAHHNPNGPISSDEANAADRLRDRVEKAQRLQETMKAANAIIRRKTSAEEKVAALRDLGISEANAYKLLQPDFMGRVGFPDYETRNNLANIKRMQDRITQLERNRGEAASEHHFNGGRVVDNPDDNRVQIFFEGRPSEEVRAKLKANGFKWAPSIGAWQRMRSSAHVFEVAKSIVDHAA